MLVAVTDTETTGLARKDYMNVDNPYIASITVIIYDTEAARVQASLNTMILPEGWTMPPEARAINGLEDEVLLAYGLPIDEVLVVAHKLFEPVELIIGHNIPFDIKVLASSLYRNDMLSELDALLAKETFCTMRESKQIVQAKNVKGHLKNPKLTEAYAFFFERELDNSHSANADTVAALEIYLALQQYHEGEEEPTAEVKL